MTQRIRPSIKVKRSAKAILTDLRAVDAALSPENLTGDGERPKAEVERRHRQLSAQWQRLVKELGREPKDAELWPEIYGGQWTAADDDGS